MQQGNDTHSPNNNGFMLGDGARALIVGAAALIVIFGLRQAQGVILPILMAGFLAIISYTVTSLLRRYCRFPHWLAVTATVAFDFVVLYAVASLIQFLAMDMKATLQGEFSQRFTELYNDTMAWLGKFGLEESARAIVASPQDVVDVNKVLSITQSITGQIVSLLSTCTLVLIVMTFFLGEAPLFLRNLRAMPAGAEWKDDFLHALQGIQKYLFIKTISSVATGLLVWGMCEWLDVPFAFLWGVIAFVLNYIPTIGSIVAAIPGIAMALIMNGWGCAMLIAAGYLFINCAIGNGIEPLFLGKQFGIATSVVILSVIFWGWMWGPCGMLLAVPITVLIKLALENSEDLSWVAKIVDDNHDKKLTDTES